MGGCEVRVGGPRWIRDWRDCPPQPAQVSEGKTLGRASPDQRDTLHGDTRAVRTQVPMGALRIRLTSHRGGLLPG